MAFNAASIRPTIFNVMPRACIRQLPVLQIRYADLLPAMEVAEGGLGLFTIIDKSAGRPKQCEMTELDQIASKVSYGLQVAASTGRSTCPAAHRLEGADLWLLMSACGPQKHGIASAAAPSTAESLVHGTREALVCLGHIRPQGR